jgi:hypothetical protein
MILCVLLWTSAVTWIADVLRVACIVVLGSLSMSDFSDVEEQFDALDVSGASASDEEAEETVPVRPWSEYCARTKVPESAVRHFWPTQRTILFHGPGTQWLENLELQARMSIHGTFTCFMEEAVIDFQDWGPTAHVCVLIWRFDMLAEQGTHGWQGPIFDNRVTRQQRRKLNKRMALAAKTAKTESSTEPRPDTTEE